MRIRQHTGHFVLMLWEDWLFSDQLPSPDLAWCLPVVINHVWYFNSSPVLEVNTEWHFFLTLSRHKFSMENTTRPSWNTVWSESKLTETGLEVFAELRSFSSAAFPSSESLFPTDETGIPLSFVSNWELSLWRHKQDQPQITTMTTERAERAVNKAEITTLKKVKATHWVLSTELIRNKDNLKAGENDRSLLLHLTQYWSV